MSDGGFTETVVRLLAKSEKDVAWLRGVSTRADEDIEAGRRTRYVEAPSWRLAFGQTVICVFKRSPYVPLILVGCVALYGLALLYPLL